MKKEDIEKCNTINDYLNLLGKSSIDGMTFEEIADWADAGKLDWSTTYTVAFVLNDWYCCKADKNHILKLLKQALKENKKVICKYYDNESCDESYIPEHPVGCEFYLE